MATPQMVWGGYGNFPDPNGKRYSYWDFRGTARTGQRVAVPAYNVKAKRVIETMFTIQHTSRMYSKNSETQEQALKNRNIKLREIYGGEFVQFLPGAEGRTKQQWAQDSAERQGLKDSYPPKDTMTLAERMKEVARQDQQGGVIAP